MDKEQFNGLEDFQWLCENGYVLLQGYQEDTVALDCVNNVEKALILLDNIRKILEQEIERCKKEISSLKEKLYNDDNSPFTAGRWTLLQLYEAKLETLRYILELYNNPAFLESQLKKGK